jgi:hypothetical protein
MIDKNKVDEKSVKPLKNKFFAKLLGNKKYIWELEQTNDLLQKKIEDEKRISEQHQTTLVRKENLIDSLKEKLNSVRRSIESNPWKVFEIDGQDFWFRPSEISFVSGIEETCEIYQFQIIIQGVSETLEFFSEEKAKQVKAFILNVDEIPKPAKLGEVNVSSAETHDQEREKLLQSLKQKTDKE